MNFDYTLYLVTDRQLMSCDSLTEAVEQAILGGCTMIQLREKELSSLEFYNQAVAVKQVTDKIPYSPHHKRQNRYCNGCAGCGSTYWTA